MCRPLCVCVKLNSSSILTGIVGKVVTLSLVIWQTFAHWPCARHWIGDDYKRGKGLGLVLKELTSDRGRQAEGPVQCCRVRASAVENTVPSRMGTGWEIPGG